ncbi:MAG: hypothetical protein NTY01_05520 [Verrucomicrobia bacterium]|nr:hypothetical protein [Verrucomicrobiota bacterium]
MEKKPWWQSKTIWANALALLGSYVAPQLGAELKAEEQVAILVVVNLVLRLATKGAVDWSARPPSSVSGLLLVLGLSSSVLGLAACATIRQIAQINLPFVQTEAQLACGAALQLAVSDADRRDVANMIFSVADTVECFGGGDALTPDEFTAKVNAWGLGGAAKYAAIATKIGEVWARLYPSLKDNPKLAADVLAKISAGCCDAARPYLAP